MAAADDESNSIPSHESSKNFYPTDVMESKRHDNRLHYVFRFFMHCNFNAPVEDALEKGIKVLDAGCGSGQWVLEMAVDYPNSTFVGIDFTEIFPEFDKIPPNCTFLKADILEGLPFNDDTFDYVFQRRISEAFTLQDWPVAIRELARVIKPGGWFESLEISSDLERPPRPGHMLELTSSATQKFGIDLNYAQNIDKLLVDNKFTDIHKDYISLPLGWGGHTGVLYGETIRMIHRSVMSKLAPLLNLTPEEYVRLLDNSMIWYKNSKSWHKAPYVYARKPPNVL